MSAIVREDPNLRQARNGFLGAARAGREASEALERGQAETPLTALFDLALTDAESAPLSLVVVPLEPGSLAPALGALLGAEGRALALRLAPGFQVEEAQAGPIAIVVVESLAALGSGPSVLTRAVAGASALALAGPAAARPGEPERAALQDLLESMDAVLPLVLSSEKLPRAGWWTEVALLGRAERLAPALIPPEARERPPALAWLAERDDQLRAALTLARHARRLRLSAQALDERHKADAQKLAQKHAALARQGGAAEEAQKETQDVRAAWDATRTEVQDALQRLAEELDEVARKALLPTGRIVEGLKTRVESIEAKDLAREEGGAVVKLSVAPAFVQLLREDIERAIRELLRDDLALVRSRLEGAQAIVSEKLQRHVQAIPRLELAPPDERKVFEAALAVLVLEPRYKGELPRRGLAQRFAEGRRPVYVFFMVLSLFGGVFGASRRSPLVTYLLLGLFVAGFVWTFAAWKSDDDERIGKELERAREALLEEARRAAQELCREKQARLSAELADMRREAAKRLESAAKEALAERTASVDEERERARSRGKSLELRLRDVQALGQKVARVSQAAADVEGACRRALQDQARAKAQQEARP